RVVAESSEGFLGHTCAQAGTYALGVRDQNYRGGSALHYRLHVGQVPVVTAVYPLGLQRGTEAEIHLEGVHLGDRRTVRVKARAGAAPGSRLPVPIEPPLGKSLGNASVIVGEFPEVPRGLSAEPPLPVPVPGTANGRIGRPGATDTWMFSAKKG